jgi:hypothetical protein
MNGTFIFATRAGHFMLIQADGKWQAIFEDEVLGSFDTPQRAAELLVSGGTDLPSVGDPAQFGVSANLSDWTFIPA